MSIINENSLEQIAIDTLQELGWQYTHGSEILAGKSCPWRERSDDVVLKVHLHEAIGRLNPHLSDSLIDDVVSEICKGDIIALAERNHQFYNKLKHGVPIKYQENGQDKSDYVRLIDFQNPSNNRFDVVNQLVIHGKRSNRKPDVICFINGLPVVLMELKNPFDVNADIDHAYQQLQTYKQDIEDVFVYNQLLIISDGVQACVGSLTADRERFLPWRVVDESCHQRVAFKFELDGLLRGLLSPAVLLDYIQNFIAFERNHKNEYIKKICAYHQYYGVNQAVECTLTAHQTQSGKIGVVWHTQGSGKSLSMLFYAGKVLAEPSLANPTIVVVTDRNDLDGQLFATFSAGSDIIRQTPIQADGREAL